MSDEHSRQQWRKVGDENQPSNWLRPHMDWRLEKLTEQFNREWNKNNRHRAGDNQQSDSVGSFTMYLDLLFSGE
ncbi:MAG: hypothetical protein AB7U61_07870 [Methylocystis sp.]